MDTLVSDYITNLLRTKYKAPNSYVSPVYLDTQVQEISDFHLTGRQVDQEYSSVIDTVEKLIQRYLSNIHQLIETNSIQTSTDTSRALNLSSQIDTPQLINDNSDNNNNFNSINTDLQLPSILLLGVQHEDVCAIIDRLNAELQATQGIAEFVLPTLNYISWDEYSETFFASLQPLQGLCHNSFTEQVTKLIYQHNIVVSIPTEQIPIFYNKLSTFFMDNQQQSQFSTPHLPLFDYVLYRHTFVNYRSTRPHQILSFIALTLRFQGLCWLDAISSPFLVEFKKILISIAQNQGLDNGGINILLEQILPPKKLITKLFQPATTHAYILPSLCDNDWINTALIDQNSSTVISTPFATQLCSCELEPILKWLPYYNTHISSFYVNTSEITDELPQPLHTLQQVANTLLNIPLNHPQDDSLELKVYTQLDSAMNNTKSVIPPIIFEHIFLNLISYPNDPTPECLFKRVNPTTPFLQPISALIHYQVCPYCPESRAILPTLHRSLAFNAPVQLMFHAHPPNERREMMEMLEQLHFQQTNTALDHSQEIYFDSASPQHGDIDIFSGIGQHQHAQKTISTSSRPPSPTFYYYSMDEMNSLIVPLSDHNTQQNRSVYSSGFPDELNLNQQHHAIDSIETESTDFSLFSLSTPIPTSTPHQQHIQTHNIPQSSSFYSDNGSQSSQFEPKASNIGEIPKQSQITPPPQQLSIRLPPSNTNATLNSNASGSFVDANSENNNAPTLLNLPPLLPPSGFSTLPPNQPSPSQHHSHQLGLQRTGSSLPLQKKTIHRNTSFSNLPATGTPHYSAQNQPVNAITNNGPSGQLTPIVSPESSTPISGLALDPVDTADQQIASHGVLSPNGFDFTSNTQQQIQPKSTFSLSALHKYQLQQNSVSSPHHYQHGQPSPQLSTVQISSKNAQHNTSSYHQRTATKFNDPTTSTSSSSAQFYELLRRLYRKLHHQGIGTDELQIAKPIQQLYLNPFSILPSPPQINTNNLAEQSNNNENNKSIKNNTPTLVLEQQLNKLTQFFAMFPLHQHAMFKHGNSTMSLTKILTQIKPSIVSTTILSTNSSLTESTALETAAHTTTAQNEYVTQYKVNVAHDERPIVEPRTRILVSGYSIGLPNGTNPTVDVDLPEQNKTPDHIQRDVFTAQNIDKLLQGYNFLCSYTLPEHLRMLAMNPFELGKAPDGSRLKKVYTEPAECIQIQSKIDHFNLSKQYGVPGFVVEALDMAFQLAIAAGLEALLDAGYPVVQRTKVLVRDVSSTDHNAVKEQEQVSIQQFPIPLRDTTGVIFVSSFPGMDSTVDEVQRASTSQLRQEIVSMLRDHPLAQVHPAHLPNQSKLDLDKLTCALESIEKTSKTTPNDNTIHTAFQDIIVQLEKHPVYEYNRKLLFKVLVMANNQLAELLGITGPNTHINAACAGTTQAVAIADDWLRQTRRCEAVIVIAADIATSKNLLPYISTGFMVLGAATKLQPVTHGSCPFDTRRKGMIVGAGAVGLVLETHNRMTQRRCFDLLYRSMEKTLYNDQIITVYHTAESKIDVILDHVNHNAIDNVVNASLSFTNDKSNKISSNNTHQGHIAVKSIPLHIWSLEPEKPALPSAQSKYVRSPWQLSSSWAPHGELILSHYANSAFHASLINKNHIAQELRTFLTQVEYLYGDKLRSEWEHDYFSQQPNGNTNANPNSTKTLGDLNRVYNSGIDTVICKKCTQNAILAQHSHSEVRASNDESPLDALETPHNLLSSPKQPEFDWKRELAKQLVYFSHETSTASCAKVEILALTNYFTPQNLPNIILCNTKGFTGHAMGVAFEDVMAVAALDRQITPPIANLKNVDTSLGPITLSTGGSISHQNQIIWDRIKAQLIESKQNEQTYDCKDTFVETLADQRCTQLADIHASRVVEECAQCTPLFPTERTLSLRFSAGFGSQLVFLLFKKWREDPVFNHTDSLMTPTTMESFVNDKCHQRNLLASSKDHNHPISAFFKNISLADNNSLFKYSYDLVPVLNPHKRNEIWDAYATMQSIQHAQFLHIFTAYTQLSKYFPLTLHASPSDPYYQNYKQYQQLEKEMKNQIKHLLGQIIHPAAFQTSLSSFQLHDTISSLLPPSDVPFQNTQQFIPFVEPIPSSTNFMNMSHQQHFNYENSPQMVQGDNLGQSTFPPQPLMNQISTPTASSQSHQFIHRGSVSMSTSSQPGGTQQNNQSFGNLSNSGQNNQNMLRSRPSFQSQSRLLALMAQQAQQQDNQTYPSSPAPQ